ncbi:hypothetical protein [Pedobacter frigoris]|uniref:hypothetical protein n=1 Tax=Pedobacter frigoris TaxID=2571272 RepID=UPI00292FBEC5|nr:hypothetical protein [Pedobacter frigoris]
MEQNLENNDWKKEAPLLASMPLNNPFSVPEGYFEGLGNEISNAVYLEGLKAKVNGSGFNTPENYFDGLNENINAAIFAEKLKAAIPQEGFEVPANYFEQMQSSILAKTVQSTQVKTEPTILRLWHSKLVKYASAACFVIIAGVGTIYLNSQHADPKSLTAELFTEQMLYDIDEDVIIEHIEATEPKQAQASASDVALESYILNNYSQNEIAGL